MGDAAAPSPPIGAGAVQDFLATGCGRWYRGTPSDQTTGLDEEAGGFMVTDPIKKISGKAYPQVTEIGRDEHVGMVREIFATIPGRYVFLNHLLSLRRDVAWRRFAVRQMRFFDTFRFL